MVRVKRDNRTIGVTLRFWTDSVTLESPKGKRRTVCWDSGVAKIEANRSKDIEGIHPQPFQCLEDIVPLIKEIMRKQKIMMVSDNRRPRIMNPKRRSW
ncbi:MAG: hypothetical protein ISS89_04840 [Candidatus Omnitrophica bacterium]|nr:hypothetical protein [Candidatus Omnitrophota bacterium]